MYKILKINNLIQVIPSSEINIVVPNYGGHDPFNRRNQEGIIINIEFDVINWSCTFKLRFKTPDNHQNYSASFDFLVFATNHELEQITKLKNAIDDILECLAQDTSPDNEFQSLLCNLGGFEQIKL